MVALSWIGRVFVLVGVGWMIFYYREHANVEKLNDLKDRIKEFGEKANQLLLFLSFAVVAAATLNLQDFPLVRVAMRWWILAIFPVLVAVLPLKEFGWDKPSWYYAVVWIKFVLLWVAVVLGLIGAIQFLRGLTLTTMGAFNGGRL